MPKPIPTRPFRVVMSERETHTVQAVSGDQAWRAFPLALRVERADVRQPPLLIEDDNDG